MRHQIFERTLHPSGYACFSVLNTPHAPSGRVVVGPSPAPSNGRRRLKSGVQSSPSSPVRPGGSGATARPEPPYRSANFGTFHRCASRLEVFSPSRFSGSPASIPNLGLERFHSKPKLFPLGTEGLSFRAIGAFVSWCGGLAEARKRSGRFFYKPATTTTRSYERAPDNLDGRG